MISHFSEIEKMVLLKDSLVENLPPNYPIYIQILSTNLGDPRPLRINDWFLFVRVFTHQVSLYLQLGENLLGAPKNGLTINEQYFSVMQDDSFSQWGISRYHATQYFYPGCGCSDRRQPATQNYQNNPIKIWRPEQSSPIFWLQVSL